MEDAPVLMIEQPVLTSGIIPFGEQSIIKASLTEEWLER